MDGDGPRSASTRLTRASPPNSTSHHCSGGVGTLGTHLRRPHRGPGLRRASRPPSSHYGESPSASAKNYLRGRGVRVRRRCRLMPIAAGPGVPETTRLFGGRRSGPSAHACRLPHPLVTNSCNGQCRSALTVSTAKPGDRLSPARIEKIRRPLARAHPRHPHRRRALPAHEDLGALARLGGRRGCRA